MILQSQCAFGAARLIVRRGYRLYKLSGRREEARLAGCGRACEQASESKVGKGDGEPHGFAIGKHPSGRAIDEVVQAPHDGHMAEVLQAGHRRSQRMFHRMRLQALGRSHDGRKFREVCETLVVSAHGGLLMLRNEVDNGEILVLVNPETQEEQECRIVYVGDSGARGMRVGVEFLTPAPHFWGIDFDARQLSKSEREETAN